MEYYPQGKEQDRMTKTIRSTKDILACHVYPTGESHELRVDFGSNRKTGQTEYGIWCENCKEPVTTYADEYTKNTQTIINNRMV